MYTVSNKHPLTKREQKRVVNNIGLVKKYVYDLVRLGVIQNWEMDDVESYCMEGLMQAVRHFKPKLGNKFSTYAMSAIKSRLSLYWEHKARKNRIKTISLSEHEELFVAPQPKHVQPIDCEHRCEHRKKIDQLLEKAGLTEENIEIVKLRYFYGFKLYQIGAKYGLTKEAIRLRLARSLRRVREYCEFYDMDINSFL